MKKSPVSNEGEKRLEGSRLNDYAKDLVGYLSQDQTDAVPYIEGLVEDYERRFGLRREVIKMPWLGASDARLGLSDVHVDEGKPPMMNLMLGSGRIYQMIPQDAASADAARHAGKSLDNLCLHRMPDYIKQKLLTVESVAQHGLGFEKIFYDYRTEQKVETVRRADLPQQLSSFAVINDANDATKRIAQGLGVTLMNRAEFDRQAPQIREVVKSLYQFDDDDEVDVVATNELMKFLRNGSRESTLFLKYRAVTIDTPRLINVPIEHLIFPQGVSTLADAPRLAHRMFFTEGEVRQRARDEVWDKSAVEMLMNPSGRQSGGPAVNRSPNADGDMMELAKRERFDATDTLSSGSEFFEVWEVYAWWDIDKDGLDERVVITLDPASGTVLKAIEFPYAISRWNFVETLLEVTDNDIRASRGIPRKIENLERHANALLRAEENNLLIETSKSFIYDADSGINPLTLQWMPGLMIPGRPDQLHELAMSSKALQLEAPMRNMLSMAERVVSGANRQVLDQPPPERRTATEVSSFEQARQRVLGIRALLFQDAQKQSGEILWALWRQYGPDEFYLATTGKPPVKLTQSQIRGNFLCRPVGAAADMDPNYRSSQALSFADTVMKMQTAMANDPRYTINVVPALLDWAYQANPELADQVITENDPQTVQAIVQQRQQMAQQMQAYEAEAQKAVQNTPADPKAMAELIRYITANSPHAGFQKVIAESQQATAGAQQAALIAGGAR